MCGSILRGWTATLVVVLVFGSLSAAAAEPWISEDRIDSYLLEKESPLSGYGDAFVDYGLEFDVDPRLVIGIAGAETTFGTNMGCNAPFNAWSWFWVDPNQCYQNPVVSWESGIRSITRQMWLYMTRDKLTTIEEIGRKYCAEGCEYWETNVTSVYRDDLGGDLGDLGFSEPEPVIPWISFATGDPGGPCDGVFVAALPSETVIFYPNIPAPMFRLAEPMSIGPASNSGYSVAMFSQPPASSMSLRLAVGSPSPGVDDYLSCNFDFNASGSMPVSTIVNGVQGAVQVYSPTFLQRILASASSRAPWCNITANDIYVADIVIEGVTTGLRPTLEIVLDAASIQLLQ